MCERTWHKGFTLRQRLALCWRILRQTDTNYLAHADRELPEAKEEMQALMNQQLKEMLLIFATHGHSGFSAAYAANTLYKLLRFKPLGPLTGEDSEWVDHGGGCFQNNRCSHVFKDTARFDGHAYDIDAIVFRDPPDAEGSQCTFTGPGSAQPITFPYTPRTIYMDVDAEGVPLNGWNRQGVYPNYEADLKGADHDHP